MAITRAPIIFRCHESLPLSVADALHVAAAEQGNAEYFLTCDDRLVRDYRGTMRVLTPPEFVLTFFKDLP